MLADSSWDAIGAVGGQAVLLLLGALVGLVVGALYQDRLQRHNERRRRLRQDARFRRRQDAARGPGVQVGDRATGVFLVEGDGSTPIENTAIHVRLTARPTPLSGELLAARDRVLSALQGDADTFGNWNSQQLVSLNRYRVSRSGPREEPALHLTTSASDYATFAATVLALDDPRPGEDGCETTLREMHLGSDDMVQRAVERPVEALAHGLGISALVFSDDGHVILSRRRATARARPGQRDVSVVEGMHAELDRTTSDTLDVAACVVRGCQEELGIRVSSRDVSILGFGVDTAYYQWGFFCSVEAPYSAAHILDMHALHASDRWEGRLHAVRADATTVFTQFHRDGVWDFGLVCAYLAFCHRGDVEETYRAACRALSHR